jgi:CheY-like chemotaxis protein
MTGAAANSGPKAKALVVDDEALIRMSVCDMLQEIGFEAAEAGNGRDGLAVLAQDPAIGLLVADMGLPGMSGEELVRQARALRPQLRVVIATGRSASESAGFSGVSFLGKPFDLAGLRHAIEAA